MHIHFNKTKIIATVGPASDTKETLLALVEEGADVFRLNFSHGKHEDHLKVIKMIREINDENGTNVTILQDLQGPKIRLGQIENGGTEVKKGDVIELITDETLIGTAKKAGVTYVDLPKDVKVGDKLLLDDGKLELKVLETNNKDLVKAEFMLDGDLKSKKGINMPNTKVSTPCLTPKDLKDLEFGLKNNVDWVALSFVRRQSDILELKERIEKAGKSAKIIAKIEKPEAVVDIDAIIDATDAVMVARGDLGVEIVLEEVPMTQKMIVQKCNDAAKPVIIATQMMESMIDNPRPTRAETNDIANAVIDGADAVMLSAETAAGKYPLETVRSITKTITHVEAKADIYYKIRRPKEDSQTYFNDNVVTSACALAKATNATALIGMTKSGYTAFQISRYRPNADIFIFSEDKQVLSTLNLIWGVRCFHYDKYTTTDETINDIKNILLNKGLVKKGEIIINTASMPIYEKQRANMIKLTVV